MSKCALKCVLKEHAVPTVHPQETRTRGGVGRFAVYGHRVILQSQNPEQGVHRLCSPDPGAQAGLCGKSKPQLVQKPHSLDAQKQRHIWVTGNFAFAFAFHVCVSSRRINAKHVFEQQPANCSHVEGTIRSKCSYFLRRSFPHRFTYIFPCRVVYFFRGTRSQARSLGEMCGCDRCGGK